MVTNPLDYYSTANSAEIFNQLYQIQFLQANYKLYSSVWLIKQLFFFWKKKFSLQLFFAGHKFSTLQEHIFNNCLDIWRYEALCRSFSESDFENKNYYPLPPLYSQTPPFSSYENRLIIRPVSQQQCAELLWCVSCKAFACLSLSDSIVIFSTDGSSSAIICKSEGNQNHSKITYFISSYRVCP